MNGTCSFFVVIGFITGLIVAGVVGLLVDLSYITLEKDEVISICDKIFPEDAGKMTTFQSNDNKLVCNSYNKGVLRLESKEDRNRKIYAQIDKLLKEIEK